MLEIVFGILSQHFFMRDNLRDFRGEDEAGRGLQVPASTVEIAGVR
jgi:hypothetical protein